MHAPGHDSRAWASALGLGHLHKDFIKKSQEEDPSFEIAPRTSVTSASSPTEKKIMGFKIHKLKKEHYLAFSHLPLGFCCSSVLEM